MKAIIAALCIVVFMYMGWSYETDFHGLHPVMCLVGILWVAISYRWSVQDHYWS
jgi:hypothetical protein